MKEKLEKHAAAKASAGTLAVSKAAASRLAVRVSPAGVQELSR